MTLTRGHSCVLCQQRKLRCDQQKPCANCVKVQAECRVVPPQTSRKRAKKPQERDLIQRLKKYEALMSQHGLDFHSILDEDDNKDIITRLENELDNLKTSPDETPQGAASQEGNAEKQAKWFAYYKEYRTTHDMMHDSSEEEYEQPTLHHAFDTMFEDADGFPFVVGGSPARLTSVHPSGVQIFQLWQVYINNVNPLLRICHVPTLQVRIVEACSDTSKIPKSLEALMFGIYLTSVNSMSDEEVQSTLGEDRTVLLARYTQATEQALINAGFMKTTELIVLQAYLLYLFSLARYVDPRSLFCLIGIGVRIATRLGLHRDGAKFGLPPFEVEQRRRLWWQIVALDKRVAEITGSTITALSSSGTDCRLPLNVNDTSLHLHAKQPPAPDAGATEMVFCLTRAEFTIASTPSGIRLNPATVGKAGPMSSSTPASSSHNATTSRRSQGLPDGIDGYRAYIESVYLQHCDTNIAVQHFTLLTARISLCNFRIVDFMCRGIPTTDLDEPQRDKLFLTAIQMLEYDNVIHTTDSLRGFLWYMHLHMPMLAYVFLVNELRQRTTGELCERAWKAVCSNHENRGLIRNLKSPMHVDFGHRLVKAWDAHQEAEHKLGRTVQPPELVTFLRQRFSQKARRRQDAEPDQTTTDTGYRGVSADGLATGDGTMYSGNMMAGGMKLVYGAEQDQMDWTQLVQFGVLDGYGGAAGLSFADGFYAPEGYNQL